MFICLYPFVLFIVGKVLIEWGFCFPFLFVNFVSKCVQRYSILVFCFNRFAYTIHGLAGLPTRYGYLEFTATFSISKGNLAPKKKNWRKIHHQLNLSRILICSSPVIRLPVHTSVRPSICSSYIRKFVCLKRIFMKSIRFAYCCVFYGSECCVFFYSFIEILSEFYGKKTEFHWWTWQEKKNHI